MFCKISVNFSFRLPDHCKVFQEEMAAIKAATFKDVAIHSDNKAAIPTLSSLNVRSKLVNDCLSSLDVASSYYIIRFVWVPSHSGIARNCQADKRTKRAPFLLINILD